MLVKCFLYTFEYITAWKMMIQRKESKLQELLVAFVEYLLIVRINSNIGNLLNRLNYLDIDLNGFNSNYIILISNFLSFSLLTFMSIVTMSFVPLEYGWYHGLKEIKLNQVKWQKSLQFPKTKKINLNFWWFGVTISLIICISCFS